MRDRNFYDYLGITAMIATPLAAAIAFGWTIGTAVYTLTGSQIAALCGGFGAAVGLEAVGIYAGHVVMDLWSRRDGRFWLALSFLIAYAAAGIYELRTTELWILFVIAPIVYLLVALRHSVQAERMETAVTANDNKQWQRQIKLQEKQWRHDEKMARIEAQNKRQDNGKMPPNAPQFTSKIPADWRQVTTDQRHELAHPTREERDAILPELAARTRREWNKRLDEIAAQNGTYLEKM